MRLTGIIDYTMDNFLCIRGFAPMLELAQISRADENIQRDLIEEHRGEMEAFLEDGRFTFFPEVILGANLKGSDRDSEKIDSLYEQIRMEQPMRGTTINNIKFTVKQSKVKKENNAQAYDVIENIIMEFDKNVLVGREFIRIDGNHRLSAVKESSSYAYKRIPFCLLLFRDAEETDKFCRALFYNINTKQIPLKMEQNLKVIIESEQAFDDDTLKDSSSFGYNYFLTRQIMKNIELGEFPFVKMFVWENKFTYFVDVIKLLLDHNLISQSDVSIGTISRALTDMNTALKKAALIEAPSNLAIIGAFTYYTLSDPYKGGRFLEGAKKNRLTEIPDLHIRDVIDIYDKIYDHSSKKIFMSMWFNKDTTDTYDAVKTVKDTVLRDYNIILDIIKVDEHKDGYSDDIYRRIVKGIDSCDLLIADLTYGNKNVHHEIGYAQGRGKKVLLLYHVRDGADPSKEIGSNLSMHDQLRFSSFAELKEGLLKKIKDRFELE